MVVRSLRTERNGKGGTYKHLIRSRVRVSRLRLLAATVDLVPTPLVALPRFWPIVTSLHRCNRDPIPATGFPVRRRGLCEGSDRTEFFVGVEDKYGLGPPRRRCSGNCEDY